MSELVPAGESFAQAAYCLGVVHPVSSAQFKMQIRHLASFRGLRPCCFGEKRARTGNRIPSCSGSACFAFEVAICDLEWFVETARALSGLPTPFRSSSRLLLHETPVMFHISSLNGLSFLLRNGGVPQDSHPPETPTLVTHGDMTPFSPWRRETTKRPSP